MAMSGMYLNASGVYKVPRPAEVMVAQGWKIQLTPTADWSGSLTFNRNSTAQVGDGLITSLITGCPFYYASNQQQATTGMAVSTASTWLVPFIGYELYLSVTQTSGTGAVQVLVNPITPIQSTLPVVTLAQIDLKQGIPLHYPDDLTMQLQLAADNQPTSVQLSASLTTV